MSTQKLVLRRKPGQKPPTHRKVRCTPADEIRWSESSTTPGIWHLRTHLTIEVDTAYGVLSYTLRPGYATDFRSGPSIINPFIPKIGDIDIAVCWIIHDINYHGYISRHWADQILYDSLIAAGMSKVKATAVYHATRAAGRRHYNHLEEDQGVIYNRNRDQYISFGWKPKLYR